MSCYVSSQKTFHKLYFFQQGYVLSTMISYVFCFILMFQSVFDLYVRTMSGIAYLNFRQSGSSQSREKKLFLVAISSCLMFQIIISLKLEKLDLLPENNWELCEIYKIFQECLIDNLCHQKTYNSVGWVRYRVFICCKIFQIYN